MGPGTQYIACLNVNFHSWGSRTLVMHVILNNTVIPYVLGKADPEL